MFFVAENERVDKRWKSRLGAAGTAVLGAVLLVAAAAKLAEPGAFVEQIRLEGLDFLFSAETTTVIALGLEAGLGLTLLLGARHWLVLSPAAALVSFFLFLTGRNYWLVAQGLREPSEACGCFGSLIDRTPAEAFWQDLFLLVPALLLTLWGRGGPADAAPWKRIGLGVAAAAAVGSVVWNSPDLKFSQVAAEIAEQDRDSGFRPSSRYALFSEGAESPQGKVYDSEGSREVLVVLPDLEDAILIDPRSGKYHRVSLSPPAGKDGDTVYLPEKRAFPVLGEFTVGDDGIIFEAGGKRRRLGSRPQTEVQSSASDPER